MKKKKTIISMMLMVILLLGSTMLSFAADQIGDKDPNKCEHPQVVEASCGYAYEYTYTHQAAVGYKPDGNPIFATCSVVETKQPYRRFCTYCQKTFSTWDKVISAKHSITH